MAPDPDRGGRFRRTQTATPAPATTWPQTAVEEPPTGTAAPNHPSDVPPAAEPAGFGVAAPSVPPRAASNGTRSAGTGAPSSPVAGAVAPAPPSSAAVP